jgi:hypothetical protein
MDDTQALHLAREEIRKRNKTAARTLLAQVIQHNPRSEVGWLLLSAAVDDPAQEQECLRRVVAINPANETAQQRLACLTRAVQKTLPQPAVAPTLPPPFYCPHCGKRLLSQAPLYCTYCGSRLPPDEIDQTPGPNRPILRQSTPVPPVPVAPTTPLPAPRSWFRRRLWLVIAAGCLVGLVVCFTGLAALGLGHTRSPSPTECEKEAVVEFGQKMASVMIRVSNATDAYSDGSRASFAKAATVLDGLAKEVTLLPTSCREMEDAKWSYFKAVELLAHGNALCSVGKEEDGSKELIEALVAMQDAKKAIAVLVESVR